MFIRDVEGMWVLIEDHGSIVNVVVYTHQDPVTIEVRKFSPNGEKILAQKIERGEVKAADLLRFAA